MSKITTTFEQNGKTILTTTCEVALKGRYIGEVRGIQCFTSIRLRDKNDRRCGKDYSVAGFGSFSVVSRNEAGEIVQLVAVTTEKTLARMPGAALAY